MIQIYSAAEIEGIAAANRIVAQVLEALAPMVRPGITTLDLDREAERLIRAAGARPAFLNYGEPPFPASICASIDDEVVHGIPSASRRLAAGQIISIDVGAELDGWYGDAARTLAVGEVSDEVMTLMLVTQRAFEEGIRYARPGQRLGDVSAAIQRVADAHGFGVVRELSGHGIGRQLHESPDIPNYGRAGRGPRLEAGMVLAIEPMFNLGSHEVYLASDNWTIRSVDGKPSSHYENTIAILEDGPRILTRT